MNAIEAASQKAGRRALIIGSTGAPGSLLDHHFRCAGWQVLRGGRRPDHDPDFRQVGLDDSETVAETITEADLVVNPVPTIRWWPSAWCSSGEG